MDDRVISHRDRGFGRGLDNIESSTSYIFLLDTIETHVPFWFFFRNPSGKWLVFPLPCLRLISGFLAHPPDHLWGRERENETHFVFFTLLFFFFLSIYNTIGWFEFVDEKCSLKRVSLSIWPNEHSWVTDDGQVVHLIGLHLCARCAKIGHR